MRGTVQVMSMDFKKIRQLVSLVEENELEELTLKEDELSITIKAHPSSMPVAETATSIPAQETGVTHAPAPEHSVPAEEQPPSGEHIVQVRSPMIGVFYRCPSPDSPPYVEVGEEVEVGQTIGLIEAMKVFSEIPSEITGRVISVEVENAALVQQGDLLIVVDTSQTSEEDVHGG